MRKRGATYRQALPAPLLQLAMHVGRTLAARRRPVTVGEVRELLACSEATARRYLTAYNAAYPDIAVAQASGLLTAGATAIVGLPTAQDDADALAKLLRDAAARSDDFDNVDPDSGDMPA